MTIIKRGCSGLVFKIGMFRTPHMILAIVEEDQTEATLTRNRLAVSGSRANHSGCAQRQGAYAYGMP